MKSQSFNPKIALQGDNKDYSVLPFIYILKNRF